MSIPIIQQVRVGAYILKQKILGRDKYPLVLMLEPLFRCNLACAGCGKIDYPKEILDQRLSVDQCIEAAEECGAPIISIPGGEPLIHKEMPTIVEELIKRKKFVYLCTNALLMEKKMEEYKPSPYFTWSVHLDGLRVGTAATISSIGNATYTGIVTASKFVGDGSGLTGVTGSGTGIAIKNSGSRWYCWNN